MAKADQRRIMLIVIGLDDDGAAVEGEIGIGVVAVKFRPTM